MPADYRGAISGTGARSGRDWRSRHREYQRHPPFFVVKDEPMGRGAARKSSGSRFYGLRTPIAKLGKTYLDLGQPGGRGGM